MSKVGKQEITIPETVKITLDGREVRVNGPKGELFLKLENGISVETKNNILKVSRKNDNRHLRAMHGSTRALIANMILGATEGFEKILEIEGTGYRAKMEGQILELSLGFSHPIKFKAKEGVELIVEGQNVIKIKGIDKQLVGQTAAKIRAIKPPEPYKGKGIRYQGEIVKRKVGKAGKTEAEA